MLGAVLADQVQTKIMSGIAALGAAASGAQLPADLDLTALPAPILAIVRAAYGDATGHLFLIGAGFALIALIAVIFVKEVPLRQTVSMTSAEKRAPASHRRNGRDRPAARTGGSRTGQRLTSHMHNGLVVSRRRDTTNP